MAVRREAVRLELEDAFTRGMLEAAAATKTLERSLKDLDGTSVDAGKSTDDLSKSTHDSTRATNESAKATDRAGKSAHALTLEQAIADERAKRLKSTLRDQARASVNAEEGINGLTGRTREYSLETAIADERANRLKTSLREEAKAAVDAEQGLDRAAVAAERAATSNDRNSRSINRSNGLMGVLIKTGLALGPALAPISTEAVAGVAALGSLAGFAAIGVGTLLVGMHGLGDAITKLQKANLDPTVTNIHNAELALSKISPEARGFVQSFQELRPLMAEIQRSAGIKLFPGLTEALDTFQKVAPKIERIFTGFGEAAGNLAAEGAASLAGPQWTEFLRFVAKEGPAAFTDLGHAIGNVTQGLAGLWMAFSPLNSDFSSWMVRASRDFNTWANGLSQTQGFEDFIAYVRETGPQVADAFQAIGTALLQIGEAAAPLGGPVLHIITDLANAIAKVADSPLGTPIMIGVTALSALSLAGKVATAGVGRLDAALVAASAASTRLNATLAAMGLVGKTAGAEAAAGVAAVGAAAAGSTAAVATEGAVVGGTAKKGAIGGALGLGSAKGNIVAVAAFVGADAAVHLTDNFVKVLTGDRSLQEASDAVQKWSNPVTAALATFGVDGPSWLPGGGGDMVYMNFQKFYTGVQDELRAAQVEAQKYDTSMGLADLANKDFAGSARDMRPSVARVTSAIQAMSDKKALDTERSKKHAAALEAERSALKAQRDAMEQAAQGFVDFGRVAKPKNFNIDDYLTKLEKQVDAMRRFRENAETAQEKGLNPDFVAKLRTMGREGALQLQHFAHASDDAIARANRDWRAYQRESRRSREEIDNTQRALNDLGHTNATAHISQKGGPETAAAAARARAAIEAIPKSWKAQIREDGAAEVAAAAARARAAITSIPTSWHTTVSVSHVGSVIPHLARGGTVPDDGGPYTDRFPYMLAPRERITSDMFGQATNARRILDLVNAGQLTDRHLPRMAGGGTVGSRGSERPVTMSSSGGGTMRHVIEVKVVGGELDLTKAKAQIGGIAREVSRDVLTQDRNFQRTQRG